MAVKKKSNGTITLLDDGTYLVRLKYKDAAGRPNDKKRKARTRTEAEKLLRQLNNEADREKKAVSLDVSRMSMETYLKTIFMPFKSNLKMQSYRRLESTIETHIIPYHGMKIWHQVTAYEISALLEKMYNEGYSHSSIKKVYDAYSGMYRMAVLVRRDMAPADNPMNIVHMIPRHQFAQTEAKWLMPDELVQFAEEADRRFKTGTPVYKYGKVYLFMASTGMREGEVCALEKSDFDFGHHLLRVNKGINTKVEKRIDGSNEYSIIVASPKTSNSVRLIPMNEQAEMYAREIMEEFPDGRLFIYNTNNDIVRPDTLYKQFQSVLKNAGLIKQDESCGMHMMRHTFVSSLFENGTDINTIAEIIGDTPDTVSKTYLHLSQARKARAVRFTNVIPNYRRSA